MTHLQHHMVKQEAHRPHHLPAWAAKADVGNLLLPLPTRASREAQFSLYFKIWKFGCFFNVLLGTTCQQGKELFFHDSVCRNDKLLFTDKRVFIDVIHKESMESCTQYITNDIVLMIMSCCLFSNMCWILMSSKSFTSYHSLHLYL